MTELGIHPHQDKVECERGCQLESPRQKECTFVERASLHPKEPCTPGTGEVHNLIFCHLTPSQQHLFLPTAPPDVALRVTPFRVARVASTIVPASYAACPTPPFVSHQSQQPCKTQIGFSHSKGHFGIWLPRTQQARTNSNYLAVIGRE